MAIYTWKKNTIDGFEIWNVYVDGEPYPLPFSSEALAKDEIELLKQKELKPERNRNVRKPGDD
ncbi:hypothetical protein JYG36_13625 [Pseudomonas sp. SORT22]|uniref:hypothetical protein n=1 Tax=Pseudomonas sp. SORT22 TaxID=2813842 RepID=UPI001BCFE1CA|nr:hypothetical protein [Pseudomonas sp. SORT22]QVM94167.1 hypothetical protein JYG36_13625 [Pseudomonas sp. SORT22]